MERHIFLGVLLVTLLGIGVAMMVPMAEDHRPEMLPWAIKVQPDGTSTVFGLNIDHSTLGEAEKRFALEAEVSLFRAADGKMVVEAFFDNVTLTGLGAKLVMVMALSDAQLQAMYGRGLRIANMGGGASKVTLHPDDMALVRNTPIASITYLPKTHLDAALVSKRFGEPAERIAEPGTDVVHWLYPAKGLDVTVSESEKEVLQYVAPRDFEQLRAPLVKRAAAGVPKS